MKLNWAEYGLEAFGLGLFMVSAATFGVVLFHPASAVVQGIPHPLARRALMGLAMGLTALLNIYSPWGRRSGAHLNPATTLTFWTLGKVAAHDAVGYVGGQMIGGTVGMLLATSVLGRWIGDPAVNYVATVPGVGGGGAAFVAEILISFGLMFVVLTMIAHQRAAKFTGLAVATLIVVYITFEAPISGMSMNPARSLASAVPSGITTGLWIYCTAPFIGMLGAARLRRHLANRHCAKFIHDDRDRCIFCG